MAQEPTLHFLKTGNGEGALGDQPPVSLEHAIALGFHFI